MPTKKENKKTQANVRLDFLVEVYSKRKFQNYFLKNSQKLCP